MAMRNPSTDSGQGLTHEEARLRLQLRLDGRLTNEEEMALAGHLDECADCRAEASAPLSCSISEPTRPDDAATIP
jgi:predicted anti-sigma-YlaC factor YlaD